MGKYRVFKKNIGWSDAVFLFDENISFDEIKSNSRTSFLTKKDYINIEEVSEKFLSIFDKESINNKLYFYRYIYESDNVDIFKYEEKNLNKTNILEGPIKIDKINNRNKTNDSLF